MSQPFSINISPQNGKMFWIKGIIQHRRMIVYRIGVTFPIKIYLIGPKYLMLWMKVARKNCLETKWHEFREKQVMKFDDLSSHPQIEKMHLQASMEWVMKYLISSRKANGHFKSSKANNQDRNTSMYSKRFGIHQTNYTCFTHLIWKWTFSF